MCFLFSFDWFDESWRQKSAAVPFMLGDFVLDFMYSALAAAFVYFEIDDLCLWFSADNNFDSPLPVLY